MEFIEGGHCFDAELSEIEDLLDRVHAADFTVGTFPGLESVLLMRIDWARERFAVDEYVHHLPDLETAEKIIDILLELQTGMVLLHGDFQGKNLIRNPQGLYIIDPMPCIGDPHFDLAFWIAGAPRRRSISSVLSESPDADNPRLLLWAWVIAVLELRPYVKDGGSERGRFIDDYRDFARGHCG